MTKFNFEITTTTAQVIQMPYHMVWIATDACSLRCMHCSSNSAIAKADQLTTDEVLDMLHQLSLSGVIDLSISGGEPLLRRDLIRIIEHAKRLGMSVGVGSSGIKLSKEKLEQLNNSGLNRLQISLDGLENSHDKLRCFPGLFERAVKTINNALKAGLRVHVCCTINSLNVEQLEEFTEYIVDLGVHRLNFSRYIPTGRGTDELDLTKIKWHKTITLCQQLQKKFSQKINIVTHLAQQILVDERLDTMDGFVGCQAGRAQGCITANGTVLPCVLLPLEIGNIKKKNFNDIWSESSIIRSFQARDQLEGNCGRCPHISRCGGCRAVAYAKTGNHMATDPRCWL